MRTQLLAKLAFRNLLRNKLRNLISSIAIAAAVVVLIVGNGFVEGLDKGVIKSQVDTIGGSVLLRPSSYPKDRYALKEALVPAGELIQALNEAEYIDTYTSRLFFKARLIYDQSSMRIKVLSYGSDDDLTFPKDDVHVSGGWPSALSDQHWPEVAISSGLARLLELNVGAHITLETKSFKGAYNALRYTVSGVITTHNAAFDNQMLWMPSETAEQLIRADGAKSHICIKVDEGKKTALRAIEELKSSLDIHGWSASTAEEEVSDLLEFNIIRRRAIGLISFVLMAISATSIANTVMMTVYERMTEIGTLRALGASQHDIRKLFILEGFGMGFFAGSAGTAVGALLNKYLSAEGIDLGGASTQLGEIPFPAQIYTEFSIPQLLLALTFGVLVSVLASLWPAHRAVQVEPSEALRGSS